MHVRIRALAAVLDNTPSTPVVQEGTLLAQFDGSHLPDVNVGGAGVVTWNPRPHAPPVFEGGRSDAYLSMAL